MMRTALIAAMAVCAAAGSAWANGGGYTRGGVSETGAIAGFEPQDTEKVRITDEQLTVNLGVREARVQVRYVLKNTSARRAEVRFGFPVEELLPQDPFAEAQPAQRKLKRGERPAPEYCRDYRVEFSGKPLPAAFESEPEQAKANDARRKGLKGWLVSKMSFAPGEEKTMAISYRADYPFRTEYVSDDGGPEAKVFKYRLSTGACWDGPIERGRIVIRAEGVDPDEVKILKPANRFRREGSQWEWSFENLEPTLADDISVEAVPAETTFGGRDLNGKFARGEDRRNRVTLIERDGKWYASHQNYAVKASSTLPAEGGKSYEAKNVATYSDSPWCEGAPGNGVGEWLELTPEVARPLHAIRIHPGHAGSDALFEANARPKRIEVLLNGEHRFEAALEDVNEEQTVRIAGYDKPVHRIRLTIKEAYPGKRDEDLCISWIALETRLNKKPKVEPSR